MAGGRFSRRPIQQLWDHVWDPKIRMRIFFSVNDLRCFAVAPLPGGCERQCVLSDRVRVPARIGMAVYRTTEFRVRGGRQVVALSGHLMANGIRSRITLALVSSKIRCRPTNRYSMSSGRLGSTARMFGGIVESGFPFG